MPELKEIKAVLSKLVSQLEAVAPYADALYMENVARSLAKDKTGIESHTEADAGVKIRAFDGLQYHEVCIQGWQPTLLQQEIQGLITRLKAKPITGKTLTLKLDREMLEKEFSTTPAIDPAATPVAEKAKAIAELHDTVLRFSPDFVNCRVAYREEEECRVFVNRYRKLSSRWTGCLIVIMPFVQTADGQVRNDYRSWFSPGFEVKNIPETELAAFLQRSLRIKAAGRIPPGKYTAILSPSITGILAHESFGHGMESDTIMKGRAKAEEFLGKKIAPAKVNICDDGSAQDMHGSIFFDDEGALPHRVYLVRSGVVAEPITESYSAAKRGFARSANARAESFDHKIYARMTNTFFLPGKDDLKEMIKDVKSGVFLHTSMSGGMEDPKGWGVQISGVLCERIKNGKLTGELYYEASITGYLPTILGNITAISKESELKGTGFCGKGHKEIVRVGDGGPYITVKELELS